MFVCGKFVATSFDFFHSRSLLCCVCKVHTEKLHLSENELINVEPNRILGTDMPRSKYLDNNYSRRLQRDTANSLPPKTKFHFQLKLASSIASTCEVDPRPTYFRPNIRTKWNVKILISRRLPFRRCTWFANLVSFFSNYFPILFFILRHSTYLARIFQKIASVLRSTFSLRACSLH